MNYDKLIERLYQHDKDYGEGRTQDFFRVCLDCKDAATALSTLQAENERLRKELEYEREHANAYHEECGQWGPDAQTLMAFEEMAELQKELCKHARGKHNRSAVAEEIADVQIMLEQMAELHGCAAQVTAWREVKLERLLERIKAAEAGKEGKYAGETDERGDRGVRDPLPDGNGGSVRGPVGEIGGEPPGPPEGEGEAGA